MMCLPGATEITDFTPLIMVILFIEEEVEETEEEENGYREDRWRDPMEILVEETVMIAIREHNQSLPPVDRNQLDRMMNGQCPLLLREEMMWEDNK